MCRSPCETVDATDAEFLGLGPHVNARQGAEGRALRMEAVAATCLGKRPDRVALTRSPSRRRMTEICATPPFHPERRLPAQTVAGVSGDWFLTLEPSAMGRSAMVRRNQKG
jgi:hypothetical protein